MSEISNREIATSFLKLAAAGKIDEAYNNYVSQQFKHHNAFFPGDRESLMRGMKENAEIYPDKKLEVKLTLEDGNFVAIYSYVQLKPGDLGLALSHIFRLENGKIVELWDIGQAIPQNSPNENGIF